MFPATRISFVLDIICRYQSEMNIAEPNDEVSLTSGSISQEKIVIPPVTLRLSRCLSELVEKVS